MSEKILSSLSIFIPIYNDERTIGDLAKNCLKVAGELTDDYEIIIINDHSPDRAGQVADQLARTFKEVRVIHHTRNWGVGPSMVEGFRESAKNFVFYTDGDAQYDISELPLLARHAGAYQVIVGYRKRRAEGFFRAFTSRCFHLLVFVIFGIYYRDIDCSFKLIHRTFLEKLSFHSRSALVDLEIFLQARRMGYPVKEIGVTHLKRQFGESQCLRIGLIIAMIKDMLRLRATQYR